MKTFLSIFIVFSFIVLCAFQQEGIGQKIKIQRHSVVTNTNLYFIFADDSLVGNSLINATVSVVFNGDTLRREISRKLTQEYSFSFPVLASSKEIEILASCPGYKSVKYFVKPLRSRPWFEVQMVREEAK